MTTRSSLLRRIRGDGPEAWREFDALYRPFLGRVAERLGLRGQDVDDVVQAVIFDVYRARERFTYDRDKGRFRAYLKRATVSRFGKVRRQRCLGESTAGRAPEPWVNELERQWEQEFHGHVLRQALADVRARVEPKTYQAFDLYALQGVDAAEVARFLGISTASVYTYKNRVVEKLKPLVEAWMAR